jgi:hypothetical protein
VIQVRKFVIRREVQPKKEGAKPYTKAPRIQRLVTPQRLQHKRHRIALKRRQAEASKDAAVSHKIKKTWISEHELTPGRTSTLRSCTSVSTRRRPRRTSSASVASLPCTRLRLLLCKSGWNTRCSIRADDLRQWSSRWKVSSSLRAQRDDAYT